MHIWRRFLHHTHAICGEFQISPHLSCGDIWNFSICGEIFNFPTIVIHGKLKYLHMTIFSPLIILVILVTNIRSVPNKSIIMLLLMYKIETMKSKYLLKYWPSRPLGITYCIVLEPERTLRVNIFCKPWFSQEMITFKTPSYENKKNCKYNLNLRQR